MSFFQHRTPPMIGSFLRCLFLALCSGCPLSTGNLVDHNTTYLILRSFPALTPFSLLVRFCDAFQASTVLPGSRLTRSCMKLSGFSEAPLTILGHALHLFSCMEQAIHHSSADSQEASPASRSCLQESRRGAFPFFKVFLDFSLFSLSLSPKPNRTSRRGFSRSWSVLFEFSSPFLFFRLACPEFTFPITLPCFGRRQARSLTASDGKNIVYRRLVGLFLMCPSFFGCALFPVPALLYCPFLSTYTSPSETHECKRPPGASVGLLSHLLSSKRDTPSPFPSEMGLNRNSRYPIPSGRLRGE